MKKNKTLPTSSRQKKTIKVEDFSTHMLENKPEEYKPTEKLNMDQTSRQRYFLHYRFKVLHKTRNQSYKYVYCLSL